MNVIIVSFITPPRIDNRTVLDTDGIEDIYLDISLHSFLIDQGLAKPLSTSSLPHQHLSFPMLYSQI